MIAKSPINGSGTKLSIPLGRNSIIQRRNVNGRIGITILMINAMNVWRLNSDWVTDLKEKSAMLEYGQMILRCFNSTLPCIKQFAKFVTEMRTIVKFGL